MGNRKMLEMVVRDTGFGIPPDQLGLLFNRFVRLSRDLASTREGTGLGLYTCKVFCEAMGGVIWAESEGEGRGSAFHVRLPMPETPAQRRTSPVTLPLARVPTHPVQTKMEQRSL